MKPAVVVVALGALAALAAASTRPKKAPPAPSKPKPPPPSENPILVIRPGSTYVLTLAALDSDDPQTIIAALEDAGFADVDLTKGSQPSTWQAKAKWDPPIGAPAFGTRIGRMTVLKTVGPL